MGAPRYEAIHIDEIPEPEYDSKEPGDPDWRPLRIHFGITAFGANAYTAPAPGRLIVEHTETEDSGTQHEELYFVAAGRATFTIDGEEVEAPEGTFVYIRDPDVRRSAVAREAGTTVIGLGGTPGEAFSVSPWEQKYDPAHAES
jgi:hypothetical protein